MDGRKIHCSGPFQRAPYVTVRTQEPGIRGTEVMVNCIHLQ